MRCVYVRGYEIIKLTMDLLGRENMVRTNEPDGDLICMYVGIFRVFIQYCSEKLRLNFFKL